MCKQNFIVDSFGELPNNLYEALEFICNKIIHLYKKNGLTFVLCTKAFKYVSCGLEKFNIPIEPPVIKENDSGNAHLKEYVKYFERCKVHLRQPKTSLLLSGTSRQELEKLCIKQSNFNEDNEDPSYKKTSFVTGNKWALLIGVNNYKEENSYRQLNVCVEDALEVEKRLKNGGFESNYIRLLNDDTDRIPNRYNILAQMREIANNTKMDDLLLFYYSGHGDYKDGKSYLVAHDGEHLALKDTAVSISRVIEIIKQANARKKVLIIDSCYSGVDIGGKAAKGIPKEFWESVFEQAEGLAILSSCQQTQLSYVRDEKDKSVFTHFLLEALTGKADFDKKGFVTVQDVNRFVTNKLMQYSEQNNKSQIPTFEYRGVGDIVLTQSSV